MDPRDQRAAGDAPSRAAAAKLDELEARIEKLERFQHFTVESMKFVANETRPYYGLSALGGIFDAVFDRLRDISPEKVKKTVDEAIKEGKNG